MMTTLMTNRKRNNSRLWNSYDDEEELLPDMIESPSGSIHSSEHEESPIVSPLYSSSSRMQQRLTMMSARNRRASMGQHKQHPNSGSSSSNRYESSSSRSHRRAQSNEDPTNSSILMGAEILRRQLSRESPTRARQESHPRPRTSPQQHAKAKNSAGRTSIDIENWDAWKTDKKNKNKNHFQEMNPHRGRNVNYCMDNGAMKDRQQLKAKNNGAMKDRQRVQAILSFGDNYFDNRANSKITSCTSLPTFQKEELRDDKNKNNRTKNSNWMVQRVSEMDESTFASSSNGNGYLPNNLISGLTCGGLDGTIINCTNPKLSNGPPIQKKNTASIPDEERSTSTLDFLANLHAREEDLEFVFNSLDNEQVKLCVQSAVSSQRTEQPNLCNSNTTSNKKELTSSSHVTVAATPFEKMLSSRSSFHDELLKDKAYKHALKAGTLWQSLCCQHVRFPAHWWDGQEPVGPPLGSNKKFSKPWSYLGRHRVREDYKLNRMIGNRASSGRILLHLLVRDEISGEIIEDIACGCYHPNSRGVRTTKDFDPTIEDCRDVWIAHRRRVHDRGSIHENDDCTTVESLLRHQNKGRVHMSPLGAQGGKHIVDNQNLRIVFGSKPPVYTVFCLESELFEVFQSKLDGSIPASVALLRHYLKYEIDAN